MQFTLALCWDLGKRGCLNIENISVILDKNCSAGLVVRRSRGVQIDDTTFTPFRPPNVATRSFQLISARWQHGSKHQGPREGVWSVTNLNANFLVDANLCPMFVCQRLVVISMLFADGASSRLLSGDSSD